MSAFLDGWARAAHTSAGFFWTALWAFGLGYLVSSAIQVFVTRERMRRAMGQPGPRSVGLGTLFGLASSSCSFAALSTTRALFAKGAGLVPSLAFLLASTNLVVELGIVIGMLLAWQFVVAEYVGGVLLVLLTWLLVRLTGGGGLERAARERAREAGAGDARGAAPGASWRERLTSRTAWRDVARTYGMEWRMVWKDVSVGFAAAGLIAAFVPPSFFQALFVGGGQDAGLPRVLLQAVVGPLAAFFTFIGSMGNIPLAAVLYHDGVAFAGVVAFLFSDLVVLPVLRIQARYYGWRMALYVAGVFLVALVTAALLLHYAFAGLGLLPEPSAGRDVVERTFFAIDSTLFLNLATLVASAGLLVWNAGGAGGGGHGHHHHHARQASAGERALFAAALLALVWVGGGLAVGLVR